MENLDDILKKINPAFRRDNDKQVHNLPQLFVGLVYEIEMHGDKPRKDSENKVIKKPNTEKVIKIISRGSEEDVTPFLDTIAIHRQFHNETYIVKVEKDGKFQIDDSWFAYMVMEKGDCNLDTEIKNNPDIDTNQAIEAVRQVVTGLNTLWEDGVVHRDMKPSNIILFKGSETIHKLIDLQTIGLIRERSRTHTRIGTDTHRAPEQEIDYGVKHSAMDLYAIGLILYQLVTHTSEQKLDSMKLEINSRKHRFVELKDKPEQLFKCLKLYELVDNLALQQIIKKCLAYNVAHEDYVLRDSRGDLLLDENDNAKINPKKKPEERPWMDRYQVPQELLFDLELVRRKHDDFLELYKNLYSIFADPDTIDDKLKKIEKLKQAGSELPDNLRHLERTANQIIRNKSIHDVFREFKSYYDSVCHELTGEYKGTKDHFRKEIDKYKGDKAKVFGAVVDIVDGNKDSELIIQIKNEIGRKFREEMTEIQSFVDKFKNIPDDHKFLIRKLIGPKVQKYVQFRDCAVKYSMVDVVGARYDSIGSDLDDIEKKCKDSGLKPVKATEVTDEKTANERKIKYDKQLNELADAKKKYEDEFGEGALDAEYAECATFITKQKSIIDRICEEAKQRAEEALDRYCSEKYKKDASYAKLAFEFDRYQPEVPQDKIDLAKELGKDNHPVYTGFAEVKEVELKINACEAVIQQISTDLGGSNDNNI